ncbi:hypothetical protein [Sphingomonas sabuli]|uniref:hypothetical protein n=1 Tax=Sphingomonas sabuli TaxID=2764186 RepID=UPI001FE2D41F|nr:hypothetical protein [Sphingomonas sabuli]
MPTQLYRNAPTAGDDFIVLTTGSDSVSGGEGDDLIIGDSLAPFPTGVSTSQLAPFNIDDAAYWSVLENPLFGNAATPHTSLYIQADGADYYYASVMVGAGETVTIDIDFGNLSPIGVDVDVALRLFDSAGVFVADNDDGGRTSVNGDEAPGTITTASCSSPTPPVRPRRTRSSFRNISRLSRPRRPSLPIFPSRVTRRLRPAAATTIFTAMSATM